MAVNLRVAVMPGVWNKLAWACLPLPPSIGGAGYCTALPGCRRTLTHSVDSGAGQGAGFNGCARNMVLRCGIYYHPYTYRVTPSMGCFPVSARRGARDQTPGAQVTSRVSGSNPWPRRPARLITTDPIKCLHHGPAARHPQLRPHRPGGAALAELGQRVGLVAHGKLGLDLGLPVSDGAQAVPQLGGR